MAAVAAATAIRLALPQRALVPAGKSERKGCAQAEGVAMYLQAFIDAGVILRRVEELSQVVVPGELAVETEKAA